MNLSFKANVSRVSPSSERMEELWVVHACKCLERSLYNGV